MTKLFFYTSCTLTKSVASSEGMRVRQLRDGSVAQRQAQWRARLDAWKGERVQARDLYCGGHWSVVRDLAGSRPDVQCFVISAGYGLVPMEARLAPYEATFSLGQTDSVALAGGKNAPAENVEWWNRLCGWRPVGVKGVRSVCESIKKAPTAIHLFALSSFYLDAISADLAVGRCYLADPSKLIVVSTGKVRHGELNGHVIPAPARLQTLLGGGLVSLNVRVAAEALNTIPESRLTLHEFREFLRDLIRTSKPRVYPKRRSASDNQVINFILKRASKERKPSYTNLLHRFRQSGRACEMKRFKQLFLKTITQ